MFEANQIADAILQAAENIASRQDAAARVDSKLSRILASADQYLVVADDAFKGGQITTALYAIAAADAACKLVDRLISHPTCPEALNFAAPWANEEVPA